MPSEISSRTQDWTATVRLSVFFLGLILTASFPLWGLISLIIYASLAWDLYRGHTLWLPARWEFLLAAIIATITSIVWFRFDMTLWIWAAVIVVGDIDNRRPSRHHVASIASVAVSFLVFVLVIDQLQSGSSYISSYTMDPSSLIYLMSITAGATAGLVGYEFNRRRVMIQIVLIALAVFFAPKSERIAPVAAVMAGLATAIFTLIATRGSLVSRRWYRWMFLLGLTALSSTWALRLSTIHVQYVSVLFGFHPLRPTGIFRVATVFLVLIPAAAAAFTLANRMRYFSERRSPVRASVALSALFACTVGLIMQPGQLLGVGLPMLVLLCGATGWADRPLHPSEAIQLETHYGPLRLGIRAYGMRKLRAVGVGFGQRA